MFVQLIISLEIIFHNTQTSFENLLKCEVRFFESVVFEKFKDTSGEFKETMFNDVKGILSLYEASFLSVHGEHILDEAHVFTKANLESLAMQSSPRLADHIRNVVVCVSIHVRIFISSSTYH